MEINDKITELDNKLFSFKDEFSIGLASGKMGLCLYFYCAGRMLGDRDYEEKAGQLIDEIFDSIDKLKAHDLKYGLAGIGLGIDYLLKNSYVEGDSNKILKDADNELFKQVSQPDIYGKKTFLQKLELLYYFTVRLTKQKKGGENEYLYKELIIQSVNILSEQITAEIFEEPVLFSMEYPSALLLYVLEQCAEAYRNKVVRILKELSPGLLSKIPLLHANRLYLLHAMNSVNKRIETDGWAAHIRLLARETDIDRIIENELSENIYFANGLPAIYTLLSGLNEYFSNQDIERYKRLIINKITDSQEWDLLLGNEEYLKRNSGLYAGFSGVALFIGKMQLNYE